ncbi:MAG TPA: hypothetical protein ENI23_13465 [bacterium]|nr:hypothetical protein [bacterium]
MSSLELSYEAISKLIDEISFGGRVVFVENIKSEEVPVFVKHCIGFDRLASEIEYKKAYNKAIVEGFLTIDETIDLFKARGVLTEELEENINDLQKKIEAQEKLLAKITQVPSRRDRVKNNIKLLQTKLITILEEKESHLSTTAEKRAQIEKLLYLTWRGTLHPYTGELFWSSWEAFKDEKDVSFRGGVVIEHTFMMGGMDTAIVRILARNTLWRIRYITSMKTGCNLFGRSLEEYTVDQLSLAYWSHYYQSVFDMMADEKPSDSIIEDDMALDAFMKSHMEDKSRTGQVDRVTKQQGKTTAWNHQETLVMRSNEMYQDMKYDDTFESAREKREATLQHTKESRRPGIEKITK